MSQHKNRPDLSLLNNASYNGLTPGNGSAALPRGMTTEQSWDRDPPFNGLMSQSNAAPSPQPLRNRRRNADVVMAASLLIIMTSLATCAIILMWG